MVSVVMREIRGTASMYMYILDDGLDGLGDVHWGRTWPALRSTALRPGYLGPPRESLCARRIGPYGHRLNVTG